MSVPLGPFDGNPNCCCPPPGTVPPTVAPYVLSLNSLYGIINILGNGALTVSTVGNDIQLSLSASAGLGSVTSVGAISGGSSLVIGGSPVTTNGNITFTLAAGLQNIGALVTAADKGIYTSASNVYATFDLTSVGRTLVGQATQALMRTTGLGLTTVGSNLSTLTNPSAINFIRINADNTVTGRTASGMRTDLALAPGTDVQAWDADLQIISNNSGTVSNGSVTYNVNGLNAAADIVASGRLIADTPATSGVNILYLISGGNDVLTVNDSGATELTIDASFTGNVFIINAPTGTVTIDDGASIVTSGNMTAANFFGAGGDLTNLNASNLGTGTVPSARLTGGYTGITQVGTLTVGQWTATAVAGQYGGTGVANTGKTITLGGNLTTSGAFACTLTLTAATAVTLPTSGTLYGTLAGSITSAQLASSLTDETGSGSVVFSTSPLILAAALTTPTFDKTIIPGGTTGAQTINHTAGRVNFAAAATTLVVTNSTVNANSIVLCFIQTDDTDAVLKNVVATSGSFTIKMSTAPAAECAVGFLVIN